MTRRKVVSAHTRAGRGGLLGPDTGRRLHWWELTLECGHREQRNVRYRPRPVTRDTPRANGWHPRDLSDKLPAPRTVNCETCTNTTKEN